MQASRRAMSLADTLPAQEKYLIAANHYRIANDTDKAIEAYENLVKASPSSAIVQFDLATQYEQNGNFDKAREHFSKVIALDPKFVEGLLAMGRIEIRRGNPQDSLTHLNGALTLAIQLNNNEARQHPRSDRRGPQNCSIVRKRRAGALRAVARAQAAAQR